MIKLDIAGINSDFTGEPNDVDRSCNIQMTGKIYFADGKRQINEDLTTFTPDIILRARSGSPSSGLANVTLSNFGIVCDPNVATLDVGAQDCIPLTYLPVGGTKTTLQSNAATLCQTLLEAETNLRLNFNLNQAVPLGSFDYTAAVQYNVKALSEYMLTYFGEIFIRLFISSVAQFSVAYTTTADGASISAATYPLTGYFNLLDGTASTALMDSLSQNLSKLTFQTDPKSPIGVTGTFSILSANASYVQSHRLYTQETASFTCISSPPV